MALINRAAADRSIHRMLLSLVGGDVEVNLGYIVIRGLLKVHSPASAGRTEWIVEHKREIWTVRALFFVEDVSSIQMSPPSPMPEISLRALSCTLVADSLERNDPEQDEPDRKGWWTGDYDKVTFQFTRK